MFLGAALAGDYGCSSSGGGTGSDATVADFLGTWNGTWTDTRYGVSGALTATFTGDGTSFAATGSIDLRSLGLGVRSGTGSATASGGAVTFTFGAAAVGAGSGTLRGVEGEGGGTVTAPLNFGAFTYSGTVSGDTITGTFAFSSPTGGRGTVSLARIQRAP